MRIHEWTHDYDKFNSGRMLKNHFRRALDLCKLGLLESELSILEDHYQSAGFHDFVDYLRFSDDIESIFTIKHLEKAPTLEPEQFRPQQETMMNEILPDNEAILKNAMGKMAYKVCCTLFIPNLYLTRK